MDLEFIQREEKLCLSCMETHPVFKANLYENGKYTGQGSWCSRTDEIIQTSEEFSESLRLAKLPEKVKQEQ